MVNVKTLTAAGLCAAGLLTAGTLPPPAQAATKPVALTSPGTVQVPGRPAALVARSAGSKACRLRTTSPRGRRSSFVLRLPGREALVSFTVSPRAHKGTWRLALSCGKRTSKAKLRIGGSSTDRRAKLVAANSLVVRALDHGPLNEKVIPAELEAVDVSKESGGPDPDFRMPFPCGEDWAATTYAGHGNAVDWNAPGEDNGRPVVASADGTAHPQPPGYNGGYGNYVLIQHGGGWTTLYAHLSSYSVAPGTPVTRGQQIGTIGSTGRSSGPHLHYEQRLGGVKQPQRFSFGPVGLTTYKSDNCAPPKPEVPEKQQGEVRKVITVDNRVTRGGAMAEDPNSAVYLTSRPETYCGRKGCNLEADTARKSGETYDAAVCKTTGESTTNGDNRPEGTADDANPERYTSSLYYGVRLADGRFGFGSEVWIRASDRGGLGLPDCPR